MVKLKSKRLKQGFRDMKMKPKTYFRLVIISIVVFGLVVPTLLSTIVIPQYLAGVMDSSYSVLLYAVPIFGIVAVAMLPI
ncbi:MAG: hypothetical protein ABR986_08700, partial [Methanomassiliicoccales archaeon]